MPVPCSLRKFGVVRYFRRDAIMARFLLHDFCKSGRKGRCFFLALAWAAGLLSGVLLFLHADTSFLSLMHRVRTVPVSIVGLVSVLVFPFLISAFSVYSSLDWVLYLAALGKGFGYCLAVLSCAAAFGSAGWLICPLLLFSDGGGVLFLWLYWLRCGTGGGGFSTKVWLLCLGGACLLGLVDLLFISPFLAAL